MNQNEKKLKMYSRNSLFCYPISERKGQICFEKTIRRRVYTYKKAFRVGLLFVRTLKRERETLSWKEGEK